MGSRALVSQMQHKWKIMVGGNGREPRLESQPNELNGISDVNGKCQPPLILSPFRCSV